MSRYSLFSSFNDLVDTKVVRMRVFVVFATILAIGAAKSVSLLKREQLTDEMINNPRYLLWETEEGLFEVEDLYSNKTANAEVFASERDVSFYIFTNRSSVDGVEIRESQLHSLVNLTGFDINKPTLVVIHGWKNHAESAINRFIRDAILANNDINVIVVDWSRIARKTYVIAQASVLAVGNYVGDFLLRMDDELGHSLHKLTIVGHSLGAHISGNVGARTKGLIETIVGLDPAGPLFTRRNIDNRLDPTDAKYVHVMHTNDGTLGFGIIMGHADYYPNGGSAQPACGIDITGACAHNRAFRYFAESFDNNNFVAKRCDTYRNYSRNRCDNNAVSNMGGYPIVEAEHGEYFLDTNRKSPYARG